MYIQLTLQERLKDLRLEHGLTLEALSAKTGLSKSALGQYESNDNKDISHTAVVTLAKFYGVSTDYLLGMTENKNHPNTELEATPDCKRAYLCCEMMKVDFFALTEEQQTAMEQICKRSPIFDNPISQRGKAKAPRKHSKKKR